MFAVGIAEIAKTDFELSEYSLDLAPRDYPLCPRFGLLEKAKDFLQKVMRFVL